MTGWECHEKKGLVRESPYSNFTQGYRWVVGIDVDRPICIVILFGRELWFGCVVISRKSMRAFILSVFSLCDGGLRVYVRVLLVFFDFVFCMRGAPELVFHRRCPLNSCIKGAPWIPFREAARAVFTMNMLAVMRFVLIQDYPSPRLPTPLTMQTLVKRQSTHVVAR